MKTIPTILLIVSWTLCIVHAFDFSSPEFQSIKQDTFALQAKFNYTPPTIHFNCPKIPPSSPIPTNARRLRLSDVKVIMALGDSITAGFAMDDSSYVTSIHEYRGRVGTVGIDATTSSMGNFFDKIGSGVKGGSSGRGLPWSAQPWGIRPNNPLVDHLNGAQSNARIAHLSNQINYLVKQGKIEPGVDFEKDWKLLTVLIGANNLCDCDQPHSAPHVFEKTLRDALNQIQTSIPRVFISLMPIFESGFTDVYRNGQGSTYCKLMWNIFRCGCLVDSEEKRKRSVLLAKEYNRILLKLSEEFNAKNKEDMYVSIQPVIQELVIEDLSFASKFDCFHPSLKANAIIATQLWNSLQLPYARKPRSYRPPLTPMCPNESTFMQ